MLIDPAGTRGVCWEEHSCVHKVDYAICNDLSWAQTVSTVMMTVQAPLMVIVKAVALNSPLLTK